MGASGHCPRNAAFMRQLGVIPDPCRINAAFRPTAALNLKAVAGRGGAQFSACKRLDLL